MQIVFVTGLPRSGSTLLCNLLGQHSKVSVSPSSPLCHILNSAKQTWSNDPFLLAQMDQDYDRVYKKLHRLAVSMIAAWTQDDKPVSLDKNRGWLAMAGFLKEIMPNFQMLVTLRDLRGVYASVEKQHRKTALLNFPDKTDPYLVDARANTLFENNGVIGQIVKSLQNVGDLGMDFRENIRFFHYEDFLQKPKEVISDLADWLKLESHDFDTDNIEQITHESDSWYRFKYPHQVKSKVENPEPGFVTPRIEEEIMTRFRWFYENFYPRLLEDQPDPAQMEPNDRIAQEVSNVLDVHASGNRKN